jgi:hypothetical protein
MSWVSTGPETKNIRVYGAHEQFTRLAITLWSSLKINRHYGGESRAYLEGWRKRQARNQHEANSNDDDFWPYVKADIYMFIESYFNNLRYTVQSRRNCVEFSYTACSYKGQLYWNNCISRCTVQEINFAENYMLCARVTPKQELMSILTYVCSETFNLWAIVERVRL